MNKEDVIRLFEKLMRENPDIKMDKFARLSDFITPMVMQPALLITTAKKTDKELAEEITIMYIGTLLMATSENVDEAITTIKKIYKSLIDIDKEINED
jgi:hypothetical protein